MLGSPDRSHHSLQRELIDLRIEHANLNARVDQWLQSPDSAGSLDDLQLRRSKKRRLALRDRIAQLEQLLQPPELA